MPTITRLSASAIATVFVLWSGASLAGRPLTVDDANVNDVGAGHVEGWYARQADGSGMWTIAPAYGLMSGVEIGASLARDATNDTNTTAIQAKFRLTPSQQNGCNVGAVVGIAQTLASGASSNTPYLNGLLTCNMPAGSLHLNLGANQPAGSSTLTTWGIAFEREFGAVTAHAEYFGQTDGLPTFQLGARTELVKNIQLDGTIGRTGNDSLFSVGLKFQF